MSQPARVSVIIPCRNEAKYIGACLDSLAANDYAKERLEVLVVDGMSDDGTRAIVERYTRTYPWAELVDNPRRVTPTALNLGIRKARGSIILILGAHAACPRTYISGLVSWLEQSGADVVGGVCLARPGQESVTARAIAAALSHPFGVGNAYFRTGTATPRWVDTVAFGCYRRDVFDRIGLFDEQLVRNQDDEFNLRLLKRGGRLLLVPGIASEYFARESLSKLWRMFFQYGYFKPLVARKVGGIMTARQVVPALFVLTVPLAALLAPWLGAARLVLALTLGAYAAATLSAATSAAPRVGWRVGLGLLAVFPVLHFAYGLGYVLGAIDFLVRDKRRAVAVPLTR
jgi:glycosyltransferase involved in cell wall biosynthesis